MSERGDIATRFGGPRGNKPHGKGKSSDMLSVLKKQFKEGLDTIEIPLENIEIKKDKGIAVVKLMPAELVQVRLNEVLKKGKDGDFIKLYSHLMDRFYGRPKVSIDFEDKPSQTIRFISTDDEPLAIQKVKDGGDTN